MSMLAYLIGIIPADEKYRKMKAIYDNCIEVGAEIPKKVDDFFNGETPDRDGMTIRLPAKEWEDNNSTGLEINIKDIPENVKTLRFVNSW